MATTDTGGTTEQRDGPPTEVLEDLLASPRRRVLLQTVHEQGGTVTVEDLATHLAATDSDGEVSPSERRDARTEIYQDHLPKLTATGVVRFDSLLGRVELVELPGLVARLEDSGTATDR